jgi:hypothetical protein
MPPFAGERHHSAGELWVGLHCPRRSYGNCSKQVANPWRECVDHIIVLGEMHLRRVLKSYADYYNYVRTHRSLNRDAPVSRPVQRTGVISSRVTWVDFTTSTPGFEFSVHTAVVP